jgi:hypothetical protein
MPATGDVPKNLEPGKVIYWTSSTKKNAAGSGRLTINV